VQEEIRDEAPVYRHRKLWSVYDGDAERRAPLTKRARAAGAAFT
jgi:hypothetical protein